MCKSNVESEYFMMRSEKLDFSEVGLKGKYSFQYIRDAVLITVPLILRMPSGTLKM